MNIVRVTLAVDTNTKETFMEIRRKGQHRIHENISKSSYQRIQSLLVNAGFDFYPTSFVLGIEAFSEEDFQK